MKKPLHNVAASVRDRLLKLAHTSGVPNGELLDRYCIERMLYRLSRSPHRDRFILKGAMLITSGDFPAPGTAIAGPSVNTDSVGQQRGERSGRS
ncbi:MAG: hypothetical protein J0M24_00425 [Verrucomicrobia bacterium]|nr:hypothetical protein [Verrucomicrobiota bacterium]